MCHPSLCVLTSRVLHVSPIAVCKVAGAGEAFVEMRDSAATRLVASGMHVTRHLLYHTHHTSRITHHTSHITHHTSHVLLVVTAISLMMLHNRNVRHVTRHTSHIHNHRSAGWLCLSTDNRSLAPVLVTLKCLLFQGAIVACLCDCDLFV